MDKLKPARQSAREPLLRIARRSHIATWKAWCIRLLSIVAALLVGGLLIACLGHNPLAVYADMLRGAFATKTARVETVKIAIPLLGAAVAIAPAFKMRFWNIGAEGQILAGAIAASYFALYQYQNLPRPLLLLVMCVAGAVAGGLWGLIPAIFKAKWNINETLFTLMFNYIMLGVVRFLQNGPWINPSSTFPRIAMFHASARLPRVLDVHIGWIVVLAFAIFMFFYLRYTKQGYEISVVGESLPTAQYAGMNVRRILMRTMFLSGAIAGIVGMLIVSGSDYTLTDGTAGGVGFTAISVAWLAQLNPFVMIAVAAFLAVISKGSNTIQTDFKIPASASEVLTGIFLFCMLASEFFIRYRLVPRRRHTEGPTEHAQKGGD